MFSRYSLLKGLRSATVPGEICPPRRPPIGQMSLWQKLAAGRCCGAPRHLFSIFAEARTRRHSSPYLTLPTPLQISAAVNCVSEDILSRYCDAGNPVLGPPRPAHRRLANAPVRSSILRPNTPAEPSDAIPPSAENAVQMLGEPFVLKSSRSLLHPPQCLPPGSLAQTSVLAPSTSLNTIIVGPKTPTNPNKPCFTQTRVLSGSSNSKTVTVFRLFQPAQTEVLDPSMGCSESSTNRVYVLSPEPRGRGLRGFGHWDAEKWGRSGSVVARKNPVRWTYSRNGVARGLRGRPTAARMP